MILPDLVLTSRAGQCWTTMAKDTWERCNDRALFNRYPWKVEYRFNSRGFRDEEWPLDSGELESAIWCVGDSFTSGLGSTYQHIWPCVLSNKINKRTINVSLDGASNTWISRRAIDIIDAVKPRNMIVMWSYFHRREQPDVSLSDEDRRIWSAWMTRWQDLDDWSECALRLENNKKNTNVVHAIIPDSAYYNDSEYLERFNSIQKKLGNFYGSVKQLDLARDGHHFDIETSRVIADELADRLV